MLGIELIELIESWKPMLISLKGNKEFDMLSKIKYKTEEEQCIARHTDTSQEEHTTVQTRWDGTLAKTVHGKWQNVQ